MLVLRRRCSADANIAFEKNVRRALVLGKTVSAGIACGNIVAHVTSDDGAVQDAESVDTRHSITKRARPFVRPQGANNVSFHAMADAPKQGRRTSSVISWRVALWGKVPAPTDRNACIIKV